MIFGLFKTMYFFILHFEVRSLGLNNLLWRRKRFLRNFFQGMLFQSSLTSLILCLTMFTSVNRFLFASKQLRFVLPDSREFRISSCLLRVRLSPETLDSFLFVPSDD